MLALIDADIVAFRCAAASENEIEEVAVLRADELMHRILHETNATEYKAFLTGSDNFRYTIYPEYKANRKDKSRPKHLQAVREYLVITWNAAVTDGIEADDALGIEQYAAEFGTTCIVSIDKDLLMIEGLHYNFVKQESTLISPLRGLHNFYTQLIMGDRSDNIPGYDGKMRVAVPKFLQPLINDLECCETEEEMETLVKDVYTDQDQFEINKKLLWILREFPSQ